MADSWAGGQTANAFGWLVSQLCSQGWEPFAEGGERLEEEFYLFRKRLESSEAPLLNKPVLVGTWRDARWAIRFYEKHGFELASTEHKNKPLRDLWSISRRQIETSVVLVHESSRRELRLQA